MFNAHTNTFSITILLDHNFDINLLNKQKIQKQKQNLNIKLSNVDLTQSQSIEIIENHPAMQKSQFDNLIDQKIKLIHKPIYLNLLIFGQLPQGKKEFLEMLFKKFQQKKLSDQNGFYKYIGKRTKDQFQLQIQAILIPCYNQNNFKENVDKARQIILQRFSRYSNEMKQQSRKSIIRGQQVRDVRIHGSVIFLSDSYLDYQIIDQLQSITNIIPIVSQTDVYNIENANLLKQKFHSESFNANLKWLEIQEIVKKKMPFIIKNKQPENAQQMTQQQWHLFDLLMGKKMKGLLFLTDCNSKVMEPKVYESNIAGYTVCLGIVFSLIFLGKLLK